MNLYIKYFESSALEMLDKGIGRPNVPNACIKNEDFRFLSFAQGVFKLVFILFLIFLPFTVSAQFSGGDGSQNNPYIIKTAAELAQLATSVNAGNADYNNKYYKLNNDIDLSDYQTDTGWIPIGISATYFFKGVFDGNNKKITGLYIKRNDYTGLFGCIQNATIKNLGVIDANVTSTAVAVGIVVGTKSGGSMSNCYSTGSVESSYTSSGYNFGPASTASLGGVAGDNSGDISDCYSSASVNFSGSLSGVGGVVGNNEGTVSNCYSTGSVNSSNNSSNGSFTGGVVGGNSNGGIVSNCYSAGSVSSISTSSGSCSVGGVVGSTMGKVTNCYSISSINSSSTAGSSTGGVVGYNGWSSSSINGSEPTVTKGNVIGCVALNQSLKCTVNGKEYFGRVIGSNEGDSYSNFAFDNMLNPNGNTTWNNKSSSGKDGEDISTSSINADGTLGGYFTSENGWTTQSSKLPGLFGNTVDMPEYLVGNSTGIIEPVQETSGLVIFPFPAIDFITVSGLKGNETLYFYNISGQLLITRKAASETEQIAIGHLPAGIYFVKTSAGQALKWVKK